MKRRFVVLDRDGTLIAERNYLSDPSQVELLPGTTDALRSLQKNGLGLIIATNQSAISRGYITIVQLEEIHKRLKSLLSSECIILNGIYYCPHKPEDNCVCRKPKPGLILEAAKELNFDPHSCFIIGDKPCDVELGRNISAISILVKTGYGQEFSQDKNIQADYVVNDLLEAASVIENLLDVR